MNNWVHSPYSRTCEMMYVVDSSILLIFLISLFCIAPLFAAGGFTKAFILANIFGTMFLLCIWVLCLISIPEDIKKLDRGQFIVYVVMTIMGLPGLLTMLFMMLVIARYSALQRYKNDEEFKKYVSGLSV